MTFQLLSRSLFFGLLCISQSIANDLSAWLSQAQATGGNVSASTNGGNGWVLNGSTGVAYDFGALDALEGKAIDGATVEFIFNIEKTRGSVAIAAVGGDSSTGAHNVFKLEQWNNTGKFGMTVPGVADYTFTTDSVYGRIAHVVFRRNNDSGTMDLFIDGVFVERHGAKSDWRLDGGGSHLGSFPNGSTDVSTGHMLAVASYDQALSNQEIHALYGSYLGSLSDPYAVISPRTIDFGHYDAGGDPQALAVRISNYGASQNLGISNIRVTGGHAQFFSIGAYPESLSPGGEVEVTVRFDPESAAGSVTAMLEIETTGGNQSRFSIPISAFGFEPLPEKTAIMIVVPHPDDEGLFFGGTMTYYNKIRNLPTTLIAMTSGDSGIGGEPAVRFLREDEFRNAVRVYGMKNEPIFARFDDGGSSIGTVDTWTQFPNTGDDAADYLSPFTGNPVEYLARWIRILKPEVLLASDQGGDYGHADHRHTSAATVAAYDMAADESVTILDDEGRPLSAWAARKLYVHDADFDDPNHLGHLFHTRWETSYTELGGLTPMAITGLGLREHASQSVPRASRSYFRDPMFAGQYEPSEFWTMLRTRVGLDTFNSGTLSFDSNYDAFPDIHHGDFLENIDLTQFAHDLADTVVGGGVNGMDLTAMLERQGNNVPHGSVMSGDANGDGLVNQEDLNLLHLANPDTDSDSLPDAWELTHFVDTGAASPNADDDGDGISTLDEYIAGLDPAVSDKLDFTIGGAPKAIRFSVPPASGAGYDGLRRSYAVLFSTDLVEWRTIHTENVADGSAQSIMLPVDDETQGFYRLQMRVE
ncbi:PIG-L family deacetylase [Rubritalea tangerina]|uniref:PIG-L family deacetylase n=2 Tax=Rubritalea tangerina TaxID=430798 RepID=A0ABW4ZE42_9BACT